MGRGRAKAKQTKVARELKYRSPYTDFSSLERELRGDEAGVPAAYADLLDEVDEDDDDDGEDVDDDEDDVGYGDLRRSG